ncbi:MAG: Cell shape-determining protein MreC [Syntrophomonadaceae bacterium]|nr:Cell shape-determining protein MreC [Bacillota bacterium]
MLAPLKHRKKKIPLLLLVVLLPALLAFTVRWRQDITVIEEAVLFVMAPVQEGFQSVTRSAEVVWATVRNYRYLLEENERLKRQLAAAYTLETRLAELCLENLRLRRMLEFQERAEHELLPAEVIAREASGWFQTVTINRGAAHGVRSAMAVVTSDGLAGSILSVTPVSAQVLLLTDSRRAVSALVQRSRDPGEVGIVESAPGRPGYLKMVNLPGSASIRPGDTVISSGLGGFFPKGLVIGYVLETGEDELGLTKYALLQSAANFNRLEEVFVVLSAAETDGEAAEE